MICRVVQNSEASLVCMPQAGLDVTEDVQISKSGSETRAKQDVARTTSGRESQHRPFARRARYSGVEH
jgi:hypothetical protein